MIVLFSFIFLAASLFGGFVLAKGQMSLLWHPYEILMIFGPALSFFLIANPGSVVLATLGQLKSIFVKTYTKEFYKNSLLLMFELTKLYKDKGSIELEKHLDDVNASSIFTKYPKILKNKNAVLFISDNLKLVTNSKFEAHDVVEYIETELESLIKEESLPSTALDQICDCLPSLGIVVAVLGIIITMQFINGSPQELGEHISAALFGTFAGVFVAYGVVSPIAKAMANNVHKSKLYLEVLMSNIMSIVHGYSPYIAIEIARKSVPPTLRMSSIEVEEALRELKEA